jgi:YD repeat-containing protein
MKSLSATLFIKKVLFVPVLLAAWCAGCCQAQADTLVGTLPGEFSVDNKGAANYTIPLQIPPGRAGMQPQLALHYNSNGGNGPLGIGFSLSTGFPQSITRGRSILARDGVVRGVKFDADDKLYLDGKRLICTSGSYGYPGSTYRTEVDSFVTITAFGSGDNIEGFRMITKDGTMLCFGKSVKDAANVTVYSEADGYHMLGGETTGRAFAWTLKWIEDTVGNYIEFKYNESDATSQAVSFGEGEHVLASMRYAGNRRLSISPQFKVSLRYNDPQDSPSPTLRPDGGVSYRYGRKTVMNSRLDRIVVHASASSASSPIRVYSLKYKTSPEHASLKLETVRLEDHSAGVISTRATELTWGDAPGQLGDVKSLYSGTNLWFASKPQNIGDFNGDGRKDVLGRKMTIQPYYIYSGLDNFTHFASGADNKTLVDTPISRPDGITTIVNSSTYIDAHIYSSGDINGDGKTDLVFSVDDRRIVGNRDGWYVALATGSGFAPTVTKVIDGNPTGPSTNRTFAGGPDVIVDIDGDGLDELIYRKSTDRVVFSFPGQNGDADEQDMSDPYAILMYMMGISSHCVTIPHNILYAKSPVISSGSLGYSNEYTIPTPSIPHFGKLGLSTAYLPMDLNGDGLTDFLATEMTYGYDNELSFVSKECKLWSVINTGSRTLEAKPVCGGDGTFPSQWYNASIGVYKFKHWDWREHYPKDDTSGAGASTYMIGDVNGDGLDDIVFFRLRVKMANDYDGTGEPDPINGWTVFLSKGDGTFDSDSFSAPPESVTVGDRDNVPTYHIRAGGVGGLYGKTLEGFDVRGVILMDYNNDGKKDFVWHADAQAGWQCLLATPNGFAQTPIAIQSPPSQGTAPFDYYRAEIGLGGALLFTSDFGFLTQATDMDGDGRDDILLLEHAGADIKLLTKRLYCIFSPDSNANRLVAVKDGLGAETRIEYTPITRDSVYTPGVPVSYPIREDRRPQSVVSDIYKDSGSDNPADHAHFSYQYSGNRLDLSGRGPLGFHSFVTLDHQTSLFKYQFLTQSFPMTGLAMREQTYRFWENSSQTNFRLITSHDNTVVFDEVVKSAANSTAWGTVYPFISKAIESRWEDSTTAHYTLATAASPSQPESIFTRAKPSGEHITITAESRFDNQTATQTTLPGLYKPSDLSMSGTVGTNIVTGYLNYSAFLALTFPQKITHGNLTRLTTDFGDGFTETVATTYKSPVGALTGLVDTVTTTVTSSGYDTETAPVKSYTYWNSTPLVASETMDATGGTLDFATIYTRDSLGRITATSISGYNNSGHAQHIGAYTTGSATAFDARFDLPSTTLNAYGHDTATTYHDTLALPISITDINGAQTTTDYDALGRVTQTRNELLDLQTDTTYAWTTDTATDWKAVQTVTPPANHPGALTLSSVFAIRTAATAQPAVTTYHDRLGRPIRITKEGFNGQLIHTDTIYNNLGQTVATSLPYPAGATPLWTKTTYDPFGRVATITTPNGAIVSDRSGTCTRGPLPDGCNQ